MTTIVEGVFDSPTAVAELDEIDMEKGMSMFSPAGKLSVAGKSTSPFIQAHPDNGTDDGGNDDDHGGINFSSDEDMPEVNTQLNTQLTDMMRFDVTQVDSDDENSTYRDKLTLDWSKNFNVNRDDDGASSAPSYDSDSAEEDSGAKSDDSNYSDSKKKTRRTKKGPRKQKSPSSKAPRRLKKNSVAVAPTLTDETAKKAKGVVDAELDVVRRLEDGPTEAEIRRLELTEIDREDMIERIEAMKKQTLEEIAKRTGLSASERITKLRACHELLVGKLDTGNDEIVDFVKYSIEKSNHRCYGYNMTPLVDALSFLEHDFDDIIADDEKEEAKKDGEGNAASTAVVQFQLSSADEEEKKKSDAMVALSDSEEEEEEEEIIVTVSAPPIPSNSPASSIQVDRRKALERSIFEDAQRKREKTGRSALLINLRSKVYEVARENYCSQVRIQKEDLDDRLIISDTCRLLVELLKHRSEAQAMLAREERRLRFEQFAKAGDDEDEEFDGDMNSGHFLTIEQKEELARKLAAEKEEEEEEEEDGAADDDDDDGEDDVGEDEENNELNNGDDENSEGAIPAKDDMINTSTKKSLRKAAVIDHSSAAGDVLDDELGAAREAIEELNAAIADGSASEDEDQEEHNDDSSEEDNEKVHRSGTRKEMRLKSSAAASSASPFMNADGDEEDDLALENDQASSSASVAKLPHEEAVAMVKYGRGKKAEKAENTSVVVGDVNENAGKNTANNNDGEEEDEEEEEGGDNDDDDNDDDDDDEEEEEVAVKKPKTGNSLYRQQLEEEERRHRKEAARRRINVLDDEAEEEELEGYQAGLGDFGFGTGAQSRENDEERNALLMQDNDLNHIVDDLSDGEGDEEEGHRARMRLQMAEDLKHTKQVITAVTEGHAAAMRNSRKGKYSLMNLLDDKKRKIAGSGEEEEEEEELDLEEMMQRGLEGKMARRASSYSDSDISIDEDEDEEDQNDFFDTTDMTEEEIQAEQMKKDQRRENQLMEIRRIRQQEEHARMRRELRRQEHIRRKIAEKGTGSMYGASSIGLLDHQHNSLLASSAMGEDSAMSFGGSGPHSAIDSFSAVDAAVFSSLQPLEAPFVSSHNNLRRSHTPTSSSGVVRSRTPVGDMTHSSIAAPVTATGMGSSATASSSSGGVSSSSKRRVKSVPTKHISRSSSSSGAAPVVQRSYGSRALAVGGRSRSMVLQRAPSANSGGLGAGSSSGGMHIATNGEMMSGIGAGPTSGNNSSKYRGELTNAEMQAGYGMGMAVPAARRSLSINTHDTSASLFAAVTGNGKRGMKRSESHSQIGGSAALTSNSSSSSTAGPLSATAAGAFSSSGGGGAGFKRSFSSTFSNSNLAMPLPVKRQYSFSSFNATVASQVVFGPSSGSGEFSNSGFAAAGEGSSNLGAASNLSAPGAATAAGGDSGAMGSGSAFGRMYDRGSSSSNLFPPSSNRSSSSSAASSHANGGGVGRGFFAALNSGTGVQPKKNKVDNTDHSQQ